LGEGRGRHGGRSIPFVGLGEKREKRGEKGKKARGTFPGAFLRRGRKKGNAFPSHIRTEGTRRKKRGKKGKTTEPSGRASSGLVEKKENEKIFLGFAQA